MSATGGLSGAGLDEIDGIHRFRTAKRFLSHTGGALDLCQWNAPRLWPAHQTREQSGCEGH
jgi:hypothetical protein